LVGALFFAVAITGAGLPPLSGFPGKLLILDAFAGHAWQWWVWVVVLVTSRLVLVGFIRAGSLVFWKAEEPGSPPAAPVLDDGVVLAAEAPAPALALTATGLLIAALVAMVLAAGPLARAAEATAAQLHQPSHYIDAVLRNQVGV